MRVNRCCFAIAIPRRNTILATAARILGDSRSVGECVLGNLAPGYVLLSICVSARFESQIRISPKAFRSTVARTARSQTKKPDRGTKLGGADSEALRLACGVANSIAFVSGNFNIVHPGHLRLLKFAAEQADLLVVGVNADDASGVTVPQQVRLENVCSISMVDYAVALNVPAASFIASLKPIGRRWQTSSPRLRASKPF